ncbi:MAG: HDOD domain-containing protein [Bacteroidota bacterium]
MSDAAVSSAALRFEAQSTLDLQFPPLPKTVAEVSALRMQNASVADTPRLFKAVNGDPVIATNVLRRVNSAYYGLRRRIGNLRQAVFLLGFEEVCNLVMSASLLQMKDVLKTPEQEQIFDRLTAMSMGAAYFSQEVTNYLDVPEAGLGFAAGLMHNVGRLVFLYNMPDEYEALWFTTREGQLPHIHDEERIFGLDHGELGARAAQEWQLPEEIYQAIRFYNIPRLADEAYLRTFAYAVNIGVSAAKQMEQHSPRSGTWRFAAPMTMQALYNERPYDMKGLIEHIEAKQRSASSYIGAMTGS